MPRTPPAKSLAGHVNVLGWYDSKYQAHISSTVAPTKLLQEKVALWKTTKRMSASHPSLMISPQGNKTA